MADLNTIKLFEKKQLGLKAQTVGGVIDDQVAGALPTASSLLDEFRLIPESVKIDLREKEGHLKLSIAERIRDWIASFEIGGKTLGEWLNEAISSAVEGVYKLTGESDQFIGAKHLLENTKNLQGKIDTFTETLPEKLQPPQGYLAILTAEGINEAANTMGGLTTDAYNQTVGAMDKNFNKTQAASDHVAAKVYEKVYLGMATYYKESGYSDDDARRYATAVAEEYTGMRLEMKEGKATLVPAPQGENGGIRQYFQEVVTEIKAGRDAGAVALHASTPVPLKEMKAADAALQKPEPDHKEGEDIPPGQDVTPSLPPAGKKPQGAAVGAGQ